MANCRLLVNYHKSTFNFIFSEASSSKVSSSCSIKARICSHGTFPVHRCSSRTSNPSISTATSSIEQIGSQIEEPTSNDEEPLSELSRYLVCDYGWRVRRLIENGDEIREAAQLQAKAFHVAKALLDDLFFQFFKAEVLAGLIYKLKNSPPDRYACLVAEPNAENQNQQKALVGIVDVTVFRDQSVLQHLPTEADDYLYVSGIAVSTNFRRKKVATALLKACDVLSVLWGYEYLVLRAYEDDLGARTLYANAGYQVVSKDPQWMVWIGWKRRVLMIKKKCLA